MGKNTNAIDRVLKYYNASIGVDDHGRVAVYREVPSGYGEYRKRVIGTGTNVEEAIDSAFPGVLSNAENKRKLVNNV